MLTSDDDSGGSEGFPNSDDETEVDQNTNKLGENCTPQPSVEVLMKPYQI